MPGNLGWGGLCGGGHEEYMFREFSLYSILCTREMSSFLEGEEKLSLLLQLTSRLG